MDYIQGIPRDQLVLFNTYLVRKELGMGIQRVQYQVDLEYPPTPAGTKGIARKEIQKELSREQIHPGIKYAGAFL